MAKGDLAAVFFDLGDTLGTAVLGGQPPKLVGFDVFPFVPSVLANLKARGLRLGVISNTGGEKRPAVDAVLAPTGLLANFDPALVVYSGEEPPLPDGTPVTKAIPEIFRRAAARAGLGETPARCLFVGEDSHERQVAASAGWRVCPHPLLVGDVAADIIRAIATAWISASQVSNETSFLQGERPMVREFDSRASRLNVKTSERLTELHAMAPQAATLLQTPSAPQIERVSALTGSPTHMNFGTLTYDKENFVKEALSLVTRSNSAFGFGPQEAPQYLPDPNLQKTSSGATVVHLQQHYHGVPVFQMTRAVQFSPDGTDVVGDTAPLEGIQIGTQPVVEVEDGLKAAALYLAAPDAEDQAGRKDHWGQPLPAMELDVAEYEPKILTKFELPAEPTVFEKGPFGDVIPAHLVLFYQGGDTLRLAWNYLITLPEYQGQYRVLVAADKKAAEPEVLYCQSTASTVLAQGKIYTHNPGSGDRELIDFPRKLADYLIRKPGKLPAGFPLHWVTEDETDGKFVRAVNMKSTPPKTVRGKAAAGGTVLFNASNGTGDDQRVVNLFSFCNFMHDFYYMLGFTEEQENFEDDEKVLARVFPVPVRGTANMLTPVHGAPTMNMGLVAASGRHTALDSDVVFHEWTHGVSNRLVGGRLNVSSLEQPQSRGMGEGWSDYFALTIYNFGRAAEKVITGEWVVDNDTGIRSAPYDSNYPNKFDALPRFTDEHDVGEVWCATLMEMNRQLGTALADKEEGHLLGWQLVVDSFKLMPGNPSFLDARDAILRALDDLKTAGRVDVNQHPAARDAIGAAFAHFGMGPKATTNGAFLDGIKADFNPPAKLARAASAAPGASTLAADSGWAAQIIQRLSRLSPENRNFVEHYLRLSEGEGAGQP